MHVRIFQNQFFRDYPYFLPSFATGLLAFVIGCLALGLLREARGSFSLDPPLATNIHIYILQTHPARHTQPVLSPTTVAAAEQGSPQPPHPHPHPHHPNVQPISLGGLLQHAVLRRLALSGALLCFTATAFDALFVLFCYTPVQLGGLSFTVSVPFDVFLAFFPVSLISYVYVPTCDSATISLLWFFDHHP